MTTTEKLQQILSGIDPAIEVHRDFHDGQGEDYIVHEVLTEVDTAYSDDDAHEQIDTVQVHFFVGWCLVGDEVLCHAMGAKAQKDSQGDAFYCVHVAWVCGVFMG